MSELVKKTIAVLFGGRSAEHEISVITGLEVLNALDPERYKVIPIYIDSQGSWWTGEALRQKDYYKNLPQSKTQVEEVIMSPVPSIKGFIKKVRREGFFSLLKTHEDVVVPVDVFLPVFHGQYGEDGCIQGLFELADVAYCGCGVLSSAACMNKYHCKSVLHAHGIPVLPAAVVQKEDARKDIARVKEQIYETKGLESFPLCVKPCNLGSSIAVSKVTNSQELDVALAKVFEYDYEAIVEPFLSKLLEINISVMENELVACASVVEVPVASSEILTYEDKYMRKGKGKKGSKTNTNRLDGMAGLTRVINPEDIPLNLKTAVKNYALEAFQILNCQGVVRFDFMLDTSSNHLYFNEVNPLPGSMANYLWAKSEPILLYTELLNRIIDGALQRHSIKASLQRNLGFHALS